MANPFPTNTRSPSNCANSSCQKTTQINTHGITHTHTHSHSHTHRLVFEETMDLCDRPAPEERVSQETAFCRFAASYATHESPRIAAIATAIGNPKKPVCFHHLARCDNVVSAHCVFCKLTVCALHVAHHATSRASYSACFHCIPDLIRTYRAIDPDCSLCWSIANFPPCPTCNKHQLCPQYTTHTMPYDFCLCPVSFHTDPDTWTRVVRPTQCSHWPGVCNQDRIFYLKA